MFKKSFNINHVKHLFCSFLEKDILLRRNKNRGGTLYKPPTLGTLFKPIVAPRQRIQTFPALIFGLLLDPTTHMVVHGKHLSHALDCAMEDRIKRLKKKTKGSVGPLLERILSLLGPIKFDWTCIMQQLSNMCLTVCLFPSIL